MPQFHQGLFFPSRHDCGHESPPIVSLFDLIESRPMDYGGGTKHDVPRAIDMLFRGMRKDSQVPADTRQRPCKDPIIASLGK